MKKNLFKLLMLLSLFLGLLACRKEEKLDVDFDIYNNQQPVANTALDLWLKENFFDKYNISVNYRYNRNLQGNSSLDVGPVDIALVKPQMQALLDGLLAPYEKVASQAFIKRIFPKQINLFGSSEYANGQSLLGLMYAGREISLYYINNPANDSPDLMSRKLRTIHHEFTHALNQFAPIPIEFEPISGKHYTSQWTTINETTARDRGFVTPYATSQPGEDFADMVARLLVNGQLWFDQWADASTPEGKVALKSKEAVVVNYFKNQLGIDFRALQREVQALVRNEYKFVDATLPKYFLNGHFKTITVDLVSDIYTTYGISADFATSYNALGTAIAALSPTAQYRIENMQLRFTSTTALTIRVSYTPTAGPSSGVKYYADFNFSYTVDPVSGQTTFTKLSQTNSLLTNAFTTTMQEYFTKNTFILSWLPLNIDAANLNSYGGFYVKDIPSNYFYGLLGGTL